MRKTLLIFLLLAAVCLQAALPKELTKKGNPTLHKKLKKLATENIRNLPKTQKKAYKKLLKEENNSLMAYLVAYELNSKLAEADVEAVRSNYLETVNLLEKEGLRYPAEFFLSYIAKQSVSDERIEAYRAAMLADGLDKALEIPDLTERYREAATWCVEKLLFKQTSGRDQTPLDITDKSLYGRCEEMQILFVAAARTVGLPSRAASTPWWAHMDNNHAWAEVFIDGEWFYTGDMDAAYFPNQTWFSGMVDKTVLILADGSMGATDEEVLLTGRYDSVINSTVNYSKERTRKVSLNCVDESGKPLSNVQIGVMVFNWGALRPLLVLQTDKEGKHSFSTGRGDFYISAFKGDMMALSLVKASALDDPHVEIVLKKDYDIDVQEMLFYPSNEMIWQNAPDEYKDDVARRKELWQDTIRDWEAAAAEGESGKRAELLQYSLGNYPAVREFYSRFEEIDEDYLDFLLSYDPKFLWQTDADLLEAHYRFWLSQEEKGVSQLFAPVMYFEELSRPFLESGEYRLYPKRFIQKGDSDKERIKNVFAFLKKNYKIKPKKSISGILRMDIAAKMKYLTPLQYRMLAINVLRANGIPADFTRLPDHILIYVDEEWSYYDVSKNKFAEEGEEGTQRQFRLKIADEHGAPVKPGMEQITINRLIDGMFYTLNNSFEPIAAGEYELSLSAEELYLNYGYRVSDSQTAAIVRKIAPDMDEMEIVAYAYPRSWREAPKEIIELIDEETLAEHSLILLGSPDQENSLRVLKKIEDSGREFVFFGAFGTGGKSLPNYRYLHSWHHLINADSSYQKSTFTLLKDSDGWKLYDGIWERLPE